MSDDSLADLQMRVAYMDDTIDQLNDIICRQQNQIDRLSKQLERCEQQLKSMLPLLYEKPGDEPPPPHY